MGEKKGKGKGLYNRDDQGDYWWELRDCDYYEEFEKEKIVFPVINRKWSFPYVNKGIYILAPMRFISSNDGLLLKFLQSIIISKVPKYYWKNYGSMQDKTGFQMDSYIIEQLPIPKIPESAQQPFITLVDQILAAKKKDPNADTSHLERQIDQLVYKLYNLTADEIKIIESS